MADIVFRVLICHSEDLDDSDDLGFFCMIDYEEKLNLTFTCKLKVKTFGASLSVRPR